MKIQFFQLAIEPYDDTGRKEFRVSLMVDDKIYDKVDITLPSDDMLATFDQLFDVARRVLREAIVAEDRGDATDRKSRKHQA